MCVIKIQIFFVLDSDNNGSICWSEFVAFQSQTRLLLNEDWELDLTSLRNEFTDLDVNGDGQISEGEFLEVMCQYLMGGDPGGVKKVIAVMEKVVRDYDKSRKDVMSDRDLYIAKMMDSFDAADLDQDGQLDFGEFVRREWMENPSNRHKNSMKKMRSEFNRRDVDKNGKISREEFKVLVAQSYTNDSSSS